MRIAAGPLYQASLSRQAIWWRGGGDPTVNLRRDQRRVPPQGCVATSPPTGGGFFSARSRLAARKSIDPGRSSATGRSATDRSTVKLLAVCVSDAHSTAPRTKLGTDDAKLARNTISLIDRDFCVFEDHAALVLEIFANDEIKIEVGHWNRLLRLQLCGH
jgi:hypothetical protein